MAIASLALYGLTVAAIVAIVCSRLVARRMELVARASHELRGPLTAMRLGLALGDIPPQRLRAFELELERASLALDDLAAVAGSSMPPRGLERVDVKQLLEDSVEAWRPAALAARSELTLDWAAGSVLVLADRARLAQATGNLLANAIEHGAGLIEVRGRIADGQLRVEVIDGGQGLPAPAAELVARTRGVRGRGLSIAHSIIRSHRGTLASAPSERGARLVLTLPVIAAVPQAGSLPAG